MPEFTGEPLDWQGFWDQYKVSIHNSVSISDIDKFNYLKGCLRGEALAAILGLTLTSENYNEAIQVLKDRFGNEQVLISAHMDSLLKINKIRSVDNVKGLRTLYNHVEHCVRNLNALKLDTSKLFKNNSFLIKNKSDARFTSVEALCVPTICSPLSGQYISKTHNLKELKDLEFADYEGDSATLPVGIWIGIDLITMLS